MQTGLVVQATKNQHQVTACVVVAIYLVSQRSKKQSVVSRSTAEAEFRSMASGLCELMWLRILLMQLKKLFNNSPLRLYCDNQATVNIVNIHVHHDRTKHIEIDRHFIKEKIDEGVVQVCFGKSRDQLADVFTKGVCNVIFMRICSKIGLTNILAPS